MAESIKATVFIPTYNGEKYLGEVLGMLFRQKTSFAYEVLIIDSGSTDKTLQIIRRHQKKHKNLRLKEIPNSEFGHGRTRNLGAQLAKGEFVVFLTQDATPAHKEWLSEMLAPFALNERVVSVFGKQDPRRSCFPLMKYDIQQVFSQVGPAHVGIALCQHDPSIKDQALRDLITFYSDVNSAAKRDFLLHTVPYRDVPYAEDQLFGQDVIRAGYMKAYTPRGNVIHSNDLTLKEYRNRMYDETVGLRKIGRTVARPSIRSLIRNVMRDQMRIMADAQYGKKRKLYWLVINPLFHLQRWRGVRLGAKVRLTDSEEHSKHSLEALKAPRSSRK